MKLSNVASFKNTFKIENSLKITPNDPFDQMALNLINIICTSI